jgi:hypothetical protein
MANQFNTIPNYPVAVIQGRNTSKDWYFFWSGLFRGLPPGNVEPVTVGASPYTYSAAKRGAMIVSGGTVTLIEFSRDGTTYYDMGATSGTFPLSATDLIRVTHAGAPDMTFVPS